MSICIVSIGGKLKMICKICYTCEKCVTCQKQCGICITCESGYAGQPQPKLQVTKPIIQPPLKKPITTQPIPQPLTVQDIKQLILETLIELGLIKPAKRRQINLE